MPEPDRFDHLLRTFRITGNRHFSDAEIRNCFPIRTGDRFHNLLIEQGRDTAEKLYRDAGYLDVQANLRYQADDSQHNYEASRQIEEWVRYRIDSVSFRGNTVSNDRVLREISVASGIADQSRIAAFSSPHPHSRPPLLL